jgi:ornithine cyclodeaminase/alanine dehydrogenase-like protein (mu-crystallin family)
MLILSNEEIEGLISMDECITVLEELYVDLGRGQALISPRMDNLIPCGHEGAYYAFKQMGGSWPKHRIQALRINSDVITHPKVDGRPRRVKVPLADGRWVGLVELFDTETGELVAMFPDGVVQRLRVGATNGLASKRLARADVRRLGLIGSGWQAGAQLMAFLAVHPGLEVKVYSPRRESREAFASEWGQRLGAAIRPVDSAEECAREVDILAAGTSSLVPVVKPEWLRQGMHVSCIKTQEVDAAVLDRCDRVLVHTKGQAKQLDNILPGTPNVLAEHVAGWWNRPGVSWDAWSDLADLAAGRAQGREGAGEITCFVNNVGLGLQFAAVGSLVLRKARAQGVGQELPRNWFSESVHP